MKLRQLKEQPLLNPPPERMWWAVTEGDRARILSYPKENKRQSVDMRLLIATPITALHYYMRKLGLHADMTKDDLSEVDWVLHLMRKNRTTDSLDYNRREGSGFGELLLQKRAFGLLDEISPEDAKVLYSVLKRFRELDMGDGIAMQLHVMRELGLTVNVTEKDRKEIIGHLEWMRKESKGFQIAKSHYLMKGLGVEVDITDDDRKAMEGTLTKYRREGETFSLAYMLSYLSRIMPPMEKTQAIPPLKEYGK